MTDLGSKRSPYLTPAVVAKAVLLSLMLTACGGREDDGPARADTPSGYEVPRWISVRGAPASMRAGPGTDYPVLFQFEEAGAPLQIVTETREWRKVCGPDGSMAWIHRSLTSGRRRVLAQAQTAVLAEPQTGSQVQAQLLAGAVVALEDEGCENGWCRVRVADRRGWAPAEALFGVQEEAVCDARAEATRGEMRVQPAG